MGRNETTGEGDRDQELLSELRRVVADIDPVPPEATSYAKAALGWRRIDAELAELLTDSALESQSLAGTRSGTTETRSVTFRAQTLEIDLEISAHTDPTILLGQLAPATAARIEVQRDDGSIASETDADTLGRFRIDLETGGRIRLRVTPATDTPSSAVETSWLVV
jgi:hypothetical protein